VSPALGAALVGKAAQEEELLLLHDRVEDGFHQAFDLSDELVLKTVLQDRGHH